MLKKGDIILALIFIVLSICIYIIFAFLKSNDNDNVIAYIIQNNNTIEKINLSTVIEPQRIKITGAYNETILVEKNRIRFEDADCPDKICVETGWLSKKGDIAVCLPNKILIKIQGENSSIDGATY